VFATTHSGDCVDSLSEICTTETRVRNEVTLHRIERKQSKAVAFNEREIAVASVRDVEVR
jgi:hypothetical protein